MSRTARTLGLLAAGAALAHTGASAQSGGAPAPRFEVVGRAPVPVTRTTDLAVFRGRDGRDYALAGTWGGCAGCHGNRVYVWDVTDPAKPALTDSVMVDARVVNDVQVNAAGTLAVVTRQLAESLRNGIVVLDLADPAHPKVAADYFETLTGGAQNVSIDGDLAYVVNTGTADMHVIDLSDPRDPRQVGRWGLAKQEPKYLQDVAVRDGLAYLSYWDDGLVIVDVGRGIRQGTPRKPAFVSQFRYRTLVNRREYGNTSTAVPYTNRAGKQYVFVGDKILLSEDDLERGLSTAGAVHVLDVSRPGAPQEVARYEVPGAGVRSFWVEDDVLYVAFHNGGIRALDVSGTLRGELRRQGREVAALATADALGARPGAPFAYGVQVHRGLVYASDFNSGLWIARLVPGSR